MLRSCGPALCAALLAVAPVAQGRDPAAEPPNAVLLVAKPTLLDPNFSQTVVLATQTPDAATVGVILNRPTPLHAADVLPPELPADNYGDAMFFGGPVLREAIVAVFRAETAPEAPAFHLLKDVYMSMHSDTIEALLRGTGERYRLYLGFAGWAPQQLEGELLRQDWYVLPVDEDEIFRDDTRGMWAELLRRATGAQASAASGGLILVRRVR